MRSRAQSVSNYRESAGEVSSRCSKGARFVSRKTPPRWWKGFRTHNRRCRLPRLGLGGEGGEVSRRVLSRKNTEKRAESTAQRIMLMKYRYYLYTGVGGDGRSTIVHFAALHLPPPSSCRLRNTPVWREAPGLVSPMGGEEEEVGEVVSSVVVELDARNAEEAGKR